MGKVIEFPMWKVNQKKVSEDIDAFEQMLSDLVASMQEPVELGVIENIELRDTLEALEEAQKEVDAALPDILEDESVITLVITEQENDK